MWSHDDTISGLATDILLMVSSECYDSQEMGSRERHSNDKQMKHVWQFTYRSFHFINFIFDFVPKKPMMAPISSSRNITSLI